jgi:D-3-phosphoglycerate dehydrogenase / 2-oxoglutarate reductase
MNDKLITILATTSSFGAGLPLPNLHLAVNPWGRKLKETELVSLLEQYHPSGLLAGTEPITRAVLETAKDFLKVISRVGAGWDNVDHVAAAEFGMKVYRTSGVLTQAVAELTIGLMLAALRSITLQDRMLRQGTWQKRMGGLLQGKTVGIIGFGAIGQRVGELVRAFGAEVIFYDLHPIEVAWATRVPLKDLLEQADLISLHASGKQRILSAQEFAWIGNRGVIFINTARGDMIDEEALSASLHAGQIGCACLDVFAEEPYRGGLCSLDNLILTPHIGSYAREARQLMEETAIDNLMKGLWEARVLENH